MPNAYDLGIGLSEDHAALGEVVRGFTDRHLTSGTRRAALGAPAEMPFWPGLSEQGLLGLHIPDKHGGQGGGLLDLAVALEALGRCAAPGPFVPTVLASALLVASDSVASAKILPGLADGSRTAPSEKPCSATGTAASQCARIGLSGRISPLNRGSHR